nr:reverse transcriptase domain-containing protein [Tanacetum cinerariifolium]
MTHEVLAGQLSHHEEKGQVNILVEKVVELGINLVIRVMVGLMVKNLLPTILAQVGNQGNNQGDDKNQNRNVVNDNIKGNVSHVIMNNDRGGCSYKEFLACNPKECDGKGENKRIERYVYGLSPQIRGMVATTEPTTIQKVVQIAGTLTDEANNNGSIKKNPKRRGNGRDDNKRTRTGNAFATTTNPVRRENT